MGYFVPAYRAGGPIRSVSAITAARDSDITYTVFTRDRDAGDAEPFPVARSGEIVEFRRRHVMYVDLSRRLAYLRAMRRFMRLGHDVYYFNSLWNREFTMVPLTLMCLGLVARRPVLLAPRGELLSGALGLKTRRKRVGLLVLRLLLARLGATIHCTSTDEMDSIRRWLPGRPVELVSVAFEPEECLVAKQSGETAAPSGALRVCYFSRIGPKKNLAGTIAAVGRVAEPVHLRVIGPVSDRAYYHHCQELAARLPRHVRVEFVGSVRHEDVAEALSWAHVFFLPTSGENFGHAIREAMAAGLCPVISDATPWTDLARQAGGVALSWSDTDGFAAYLSLLARMSPQELRALRTRVLDAYQAWLGSQVSSGALMDDLFARLAGRAVAPMVAAGGIGERQTERA
ncbi:glycosyltransferase [Micromonospora sp. NPDC005806]|uniref:glycosyltransferase n=1 Tax=Micromonospora sp. NPDC005806 TaxID=3364234 RepID=UPI00367EDBF8